jgi:hypothetical protein
LVEFFFNLKHTFAFEFALAPGALAKYCDNNERVMRMFKISLGVWGLVLAVIFGNALMVSGQANEETMCIPMGNILLEPPESVQATRTPVNFPHSTHFGYKCQTCHHKWETDAPVVSCTTSGCHDLTESPQKSAKDNSTKEPASRYFKTAFHQMCISCHKEMKSQNKKLEMSGKILTEKLPNTGPVGCSECHVKEE